MKNLNSSNMGNDNPLALAGSGWGFWAALRSICKGCAHIEIYNPYEADELQLFFSEHPEIDFSLAGSINELTSNYVVCAGLKDIITSDLLAKRTFLNIHYSLLPAYRGLHSTVWAILNNEKYLGYTIHLINTEIDDGPILFQHSVENDFKSTAGYYMDLFNSHVENNLSKVISEFISGKTQPVEQDKSQASWVGKRNIEDCKINFNSPNAKLQVFFRALSPPYPSPFFVVKGQKFYPNKYAFHKATIETHIGRVLNINQDGIWIKTMDGYIILDDIKTSDGVMIDKSEFKIGLKLDDHC